MNAKRPQVSGYDLILETYGHAVHPVRISYRVNRCGFVDDSLHWHKYLFALRPK